MSCLFNSLGAHTGESASVVRSKIVEFMQTNPALGSDISTTNAIEWESGKSVNDYLQHMKQPSTWGGAIEISAFVQLYKTNVCVHNVRDTNTRLMRFVGDSSRCVSISWNGSHFEPILK